jgi:hypothetical protein
MPAILIVIAIPNEMQCYCAILRITIIGVFSMAKKSAKDELIKRLRADAERTLKICQEAEENKELTVEELEKRVTKIEQCIPGALQGVCFK